MDVTIGELPPGRWPEAGAMAGRAFWREDYNRVLSEDPIERFAIVQDIYLRMNEPTPAGRTLAAFAGDHIVGVACVDGPEQCYFCSLDPTEPTRSDPASQNALSRRLNDAASSQNDACPAFGMMWMAA